MKLHKNIMVKIAKIVMGLPHAGKRTWIRKKNYPHYDIVTENDELSKVQAAIARNSSENKPMIINTEGYENHAIKLATQLKEEEYSIELIHIKTPLNICLERASHIMDKDYPNILYHRALMETKLFHSLLKLSDGITIVDYYSNEHIFIDMDGVIASLDILPMINGNIDFVNSSHFKYLTPVLPVINKLLEMQKTGKYTLYILSAAPNSIIIKDKNDWLDKHFPIIQSRRFFINMGSFKANMIEGLSQKLMIPKRDMLLVEDTLSTIQATKEKNINSMHISEFLTHKF